ncbi:MAG: Uma2 family endonuclease [Chloroflexota bacterium]
MILRAETTIDWSTFPTGDGEPMAETETHRVQMNDLIFALDTLVAAVDRVYVGGNMLMYYNPASGLDHVSADVFVTFGVARGVRQKWETWREGGVFADVVFEISSPSTIREDLGPKMAKYAALGVKEYYLYDPLKDLSPYLRGFKLVSGHYEPLVQLSDGMGYRSPMLGTTLRVRGDWLRVIDPESGEPLLIPAELAAAHREAEERAAYQTERARRESERAQSEAQRAQSEAQRAYSEAERADREALARQDAEAALREALAELARLRGNA